ncbi:hypothetical protein ACFL5G_04505 [Candidatus Margulisiibacteriota bacterium]
MLKKIIQMDKPVVDNKEIIDFIDLGFEDALRLKELSEKNPKLKLMGIERPSLKGSVSVKVDNIDLRWGGVLKELTEIQGESVKTVNSDFMFSEFYVIGWKELFPAAKLNEVSMGDLGRRVHGGFFIELFMSLREEVLKQVRRILLPHGRFYISEYRANIESLSECLKDAGFDFAEKELEIAEMDKTKFLKLLRDKRKEGMDSQLFPIMRIEAHKKKNWVNFI